MSAMVTNISLFSSWFLSGLWVGHWIFSVWTQSQWVHFSGGRYVQSRAGKAQLGNSSLTRSHYWYWCWEQPEKPHLADCACGSKHLDFQPLPYWGFFSWISATTRCSHINVVLISHYSSSSLLPDGGHTDKMTYIYETLISWDTHGIVDAVNMCQCVLFICVWMFSMLTTSDHISQIIQLLGKVPPAIALSGKYSAQFFGHRGKTANMFYICHIWADCVIPCFTSRLPASCWSTEALEPVWCSGGEM